MSSISIPFSQPSSCLDFCTNDAGMISNHGPVHQRQSSQQESLSGDDQKQKQELDELLAQAMSQLTFEERQKEQEVLHGVDEDVEDVSFIDRALQDLNHHLSCNKQDTVYEMAERMDPGYVHARPFRVMFLRANEYDSEASADQMVRFFEVKNQLFGRDKVAKDITLDDFDDDDIACLKTGWQQLGGRDQSGRQIILSFGGLLGSLMGSYSLQSVLRVQYFVQMKALEEEEVQLRGRVSIWCAMGFLKSNNNGNGYVDSFRTARALPQKVAAIHICVDELHQALLCNAVLKVMQGNMRARVRVHCGSRMECQYQLSTYGIPSQALPMCDNGTMSLDRHLDWVRCCAMKDNTNFAGNPSGSLPLTASAISPNPEDVLFAGVKTKHEGNKRFRALILNFSQAYDSGTDDTKKQIVSNIVETIRASGGRFLKKTKRSAMEWEEVPPNELRKKVMQVFRNRRRINGPKPKVTTSDGILIAGKPLPADVVFGRGQRNAGTEKLHALVKENFERYESLDRGVKMRLVESIMKIVMDQGGRFLQPSDWEPSRWVELSHENARERISKCFRNHRR